MKIRQRLFAVCFVVISSLILITFLNVHILRKRTGNSFLVNSKEDTSFFGELMERLASIQVSLAKIPFMVMGIYPNKDIAESTNGYKLMDDKLSSKEKSKGKNIPFPEVLVLSNETEHKNNVGSDELLVLSDKKKEEKPKSDSVADELLVLSDKKKEQKPKSDSVADELLVLSDKKKEQKPKSDSVADELLVLSDKKKEEKPKSDSVADELLVLSDKKKEKKPKSDSVADELLVLSDKKKEKKPKSDSVADELLVLSDKKKEKKPKGSLETAEILLFSPDNGKDNNISQNGQGSEIVILSDHKNKSKNIEDSAEPDYIVYSKKDKKQKGNHYLPDTIIVDKKKEKEKNDKNKDEWNLPFVGHRDSSKGMQNAVHTVPKLFKEPIKQDFDIQKNVLDQLDGSIYNFDQSKRAFNNELSQQIRGSKRQQGTMGPVGHLRPQYGEEPIIQRNDSMIKKQMPNMFYPFQQNTINSSMQFDNESDRGSPSRPKDKEPKIIILPIVSKEHRAAQEDDKNRNGEEQSPKSMVVNLNLTSIDVNKKPSGEEKSPFKEPSEKDKKSKHKKPKIVTSRSDKSEKHRRSNKLHSKKKKDDDGERKPPFKVRKRKEAVEKIDDKRIYVDLDPHANEKIEKFNSEILSVDNRMSNNNNDQILNDVMSKSLKTSQSTADKMITTDSIKANSVTSGPTSTEITGLKLESTKEEPLKSLNVEHVPVKKKEVADQFLTKDPALTSDSSIDTTEEIIKNTEKTKNIGSEVDEVVPEVEQTMQRAIPKKTEPLNKEETGGQDEMLIDLKPDNSVSSGTAENKENQTIEKTNEKGKGEDKPEAGDKTKKIDFLQPYSDDNKKPKYKHSNPLHLSKDLNSLNNMSNDGYAAMISFQYPSIKEILDFSSKVRKERETLKEEEEKKKKNPESIDSESGKKKKDSNKEPILVGYGSKKQTGAKSFENEFETISKEIESLKKPMITPVTDDLGLTDKTDLTRDLQGSQKEDDLKQSELNPAAFSIPIEKKEEGHKNQDNLSSVSKLGLPDNKLEMNSS